MRVTLICLVLVCCCFDLHAADSSEAAKKRELNKRIAILITALTDSRERMHDRAIQALADIGQATLPDLEILAQDKNPQLRLRVALVLTQIQGPEARDLLLQMSHDSESAVREVVALGLGRKTGDEVLRRLALLLNDEIPSVRESAALAIALTDDGRGIRLLANALVMETIPEHITPQQEHALKRARSAKYDALKSMCLRPHQMEFVIRYVDQLEGPVLHTLLEVTWVIGDPRLCPALTAVLHKDIDLESQRLCAKSLRANGDSRCIQVLCEIAAAGIGPALESAKTLSALTGHQSGPGKGWELWWRDHEQVMQDLIKRDTFIAHLHDPTYQPTAAELQQFSPQQLDMLISGILGDGARHWPEQAWLALKRDDPKRWSSHLLKQHAVEASEVRRVGLLLIMLRLGDPGVRPELQQRYQTMNASLREIAKTSSTFGANNSERLVLELFND